MKISMSFKVFEYILVNIYENLVLVKVYENLGFGQIVEKILILVNIFGKSRF